jgi:Arc/MetJ-type ribon-helix-helix transcriptional regulator
VPKFWGLIIKDIQVGTWKFLASLVFFSTKKNIQFSFSFVTIMNVSLLQWTGWVERRVKNKEFSSASECVRHCIRVADAIERVSGPAGASFSSRAELEDILEAAFAAPATPLTAERKRRIASKAGL